MSAVFTLAGALALLQVPVLLDRFDGRLSSRWIVRLGASSLFAGALLSHIGLALITAPTVLRALHLHRFAAICDRLLLHLGVAVPSYLGWFALVLFAGSSVLWVRGVIRAVGADRSLRAGLEHLSTSSWCGYPVRIVESSVATAFGLGGRNSTIVVTTELLNRLEVEERDVVLAHEAAHLRYRDPALLRALRSLELAAPRWLLLRRAIGCVRLAIERAADESASGRAPQRRKAAVIALLKATGIEAPLAPAISSVETVARRIQALRRPAPRVSASSLLVATLLVAALLGVSIGGIANWLSHGHTALALAGWCPI
jgi:hypothetical protein